MENILEMVEISKSFPGVKALQNVSFSVAKGEVHALVGENGAGKSTLMKVLSGAYISDSGHIKIDGNVVKDINPNVMINLGVAVIYQEFMLSPHLTVAENIFLGRMPKNKYGILDWAKMQEDTLEICKKLELDLDPKAKVKDLSVAKRQMVEIAKAMSKNARIIVLDEPTAVLGDNELQGLFRLVRMLSEKGVSFIYISHRLNEVFEITQRVTIMKDGQVVKTDDTKNLDTDKLVQGMVGRELKDVYPIRTCEPGEEAIIVEGLNRKNVLHDINFSVCKGEIVGFAGLAGAGRSEVLRAISGADEVDSGKIKIFGREYSPKSPRDSISQGIGMLPEDRKTEGLFLDQSVIFNTTITSFRDFIKNNILSLNQEKKVAVDYINKLNVRPNNPVAKIKNLSGGNQQKVVFAKWLNAKCKIMLIDEPTRGIDVGAKQEIYKLIAELVDKGVTVVVVSSELPEVLGLCDRILVMNQGRIVANLHSSIASEELIMKYATGQAVQENVNMCLGSFGEKSAI